MAQRLFFLQRANAVILLGTVRTVAHACLQQRRTFTIKEWGTRDWCGGQTFKQYGTGSKIWIDKCKNLSSLTKMAMLAAQRPKVCTALHIFPPTQKKTLTIFVDDAHVWFSKDNWKLGIDLPSCHHCDSSSSWMEQSAAQPCEQHASMMRLVNGSSSFALLEVTAS